MAFYANAPLPDVNSRQPAMTVRPPSTSLLTIDSEDRFTDYDQAIQQIAQPVSSLNATPYYFAITKNESLMNGFFTRVGISELNFPWAIPNINLKTCQIGVVTSGSSVDVSSIEILRGFYTPDALANAIQAQVRAISAALLPFTISYGGSDEPIFIYNTNTPGLNIQFAPLPYGSDQYPYPNTTKQLFNLMGFSGLNVLPSERGFSGYTFCQYTRYVDIACVQLTNNQSLKDQTSQPVARDVLTRVYLGNANIPGNVPANETGPDFCPPGCAPFTIYRDYATPKQIQWIPNQPIPGYLVFQVYDDAGAPLFEVIPSVSAPTPAQEQAGYLDWSMSLLVSEN
jgi:hypothetical protein